MNFNNTSSSSAAAAASALPPKPGDWDCTQCNYKNFARNTHCRTCKTAKPHSVATTTEPVTKLPLIIPTPVMPITDETGFHLIVEGKLVVLNSVLSKETRMPLTFKELYDMQQEELLAIPMDRREYKWRCKRCLFVSHIFTLDCKRCNRARDNPFGVKEAWKCPKCKVIIFANKDMCRRCKAHRDDWTCSGCNFYNFKEQRTCKQCSTEKPSTKPADGVEIG